MPTRSEKDSRIQGFFFAAMFVFRMRVFLHRDRLAYGGTTSQYLRCEVFDHIGGTFPMIRLVEMNSRRADARRRPSERDRVPLFLCDKQGVPMPVTNDYYLQAVSAFDQQLYSQAVNVARFGIDQFPDDGRLWQVLGTSLWFLGDIEEAQETLEMASCLAPLGPLAQFTLGWIYGRQEKKDLASTIFEHLLQEDRCPTALLNKIACVCGRIGEYELALRACETLSYRRPKHHGALFGIAYYKMRLGEPLEEVVIPLSLAMDLAPEILSYRMNLVFVWTDLEEYGKAYQLLRDVDLDRVSHPCWLRKMALVFEHFNDLDNLAACLRRLEQVNGVSEQNGGKGIL